jgi:hypothetical protein
MNAEEELRYPILVIRSSLTDPPLDLRENRHGEFTNGLGFIPSPFCFTSSIRGITDGVRGPQR